MSTLACIVCIAHLNIAQILLDNILSTAALTAPLQEEVVIKPELMDEDVVEDNIEDSVIEDVAPSPHNHAELLDIVKQEPDDLHSPAGSTNLDQELLLAQSFSSESAEFRTYKRYCEWKKDKEITSDDESVLLSYFQLLADTLMPTTLTTRFCHLNIVLKKVNGSDLSEYKTLKEFILNAKKGYTVPPLPVLTTQQVETYLNLDEDRYFLNQVVLVLGFYGNMSMKDIYNLELKDVTDEIGQIRVNYFNSKSRRQREVLISGCGEPLLRRYLNMRAKLPAGPFLYIMRGNQIGAIRLSPGAIGKVCQSVAVTLKLDDPTRYSSTSMRRKYFYK